jgi:hypothetical protein
VTRRSRTANGTLRTKTTRLEINKIQEVTVGRKIRKKKKGEREEERGGKK